MPGDVLLGSLNTLQQWLAPAASALDLRATDVQAFSPNSTKIERFGLMTGALRSSQIVTTPAADLWRAQDVLSGMKNNLTDRES